LSKTLMTYVLKDESLSKYHLVGGIAVPYRPKSELIQLARRYQELWNAEDHGNKKPPSYKAFLAKVTDPSIVVLDSAKSRLELLQAARPANRSVVQALAIRSSELQRAWLKREGKKMQPMLLCINAQDNSSNSIRRRRRNKDEHGALWEQENIEVLLNSNTPQRVVEVPVVNHGLNDWMHLDTAAFMATLKMPNDEAKFLKRLLVGYDPNLDRTVDSCIQFIFRTSVRDADSDKETFMVVSDLTLATQVNKELNNHITIVPPSELIPTWRPFSIASSVQYESPEAARKRARIYEATPEGKQRRKELNKTNQVTYGPSYYAISSAIRRTKIQLEASPNDNALLSKLTELYASRDAEREARKAAK
jgi:hypothetical protein